MARSVSYPSGAVVAFDYLDYDDDDDDFDFEDFLEDVRHRILQAYPSARPADKWLDREDHAIAANDHAYFGVSEYMGLVSVWAVERGDAERPDLAARWIAQISDGFLKRFGSLRKLGHMSNGEGVFERIAA